MVLGVALENVAMSLFSLRERVLPDAFKLGLVERRQFRQKNLSHLQKVHTTS